MITLGLAFDFFALAASVVSAAAAALLVMIWFNHFHSNLLLLTANGHLATATSFALLFVHTFYGTTDYGVMGHRIAFIIGLVGAALVTIGYVLIYMKYVRPAHAILGEISGLDNKS